MRIRARRLFAILLCLCAVMGMLCVNVLAEETSCTHTFDADGSCTACGTAAAAKLTNYNLEHINYYATLCQALEAAEYGQHVYALKDSDEDITIPKGVTFFSGEDYGNPAAYNLSGSVSNNGTIWSGSFSGPVNNNGTIGNGSFSGPVTSSGTIRGGRFSGVVTNISTGGEIATIEGGIFYAEVENRGKILAGGFKNKVNNNGGIEDGWFDGEVYSSGLIDGGDFDGPVTIAGWIFGGNFYGPVTVVVEDNPELGAVIGGCFDNTLTLKPGGKVINEDDQYPFELTDNFRLINEGGVIICQAHIMLLGPTCKEKAICKLCGERYGDYGPHFGRCRTNEAGDTIIDSCGLCETGLGSVTLKAEDAVYDGMPYAGAVVSYSTDWNGSRDLTVTYQTQDGTAPTDVGSYTAVIKVQGVSASTVFQITERDLSNASVDTADTMAYTGEPLEPTVSVSLDGTALTKDVDYVLSYSDNVFAGTATVTVTGMGNYSGIASASFSITEAVCTACGNTYGRPDGAGAEAAKNETCGTDGYTGDICCETCGEITTKGTVIKATGEHTFGDWGVVKAPSTAAKGEQQRSCRLCGHVESMEIPRLAGAPPTGDNSKGMLYGSMLAVSIAALVALLAPYKKRKQINCK